MTRALSIYTRFSLIMLAAALFFGVVAAFAFLYPEVLNKAIPFHQLRPMHVSAALFWIIGGAAGGILYFKREVFGVGESRMETAFVVFWITTVVSVFGFYLFGKFGGREYWEFPPALCLPILVAWGLFMYSYFSVWRRKKGQLPLYVWMWSTGIVFFLITFLEQNLYHIPWFRESFLREITVQWKSNGAMVGAWNQMIYGSSLYLIVQLSGDERRAQTKKAFFFYFLGLTNLMFNWGHHIYNVPAAAWIRHVSYLVSMTEWILFISIIRDFRRSTPVAYRRRLTYRLLMASEFWVFLNLILALMMSIPAVNRYTHGTHITVAHAMGATIGINTMILLAVIGHFLKIDNLPLTRRKRIRNGLTLVQLSLLVFWLSLIVAGILKGYRETALGMGSFQEIMQPVLRVLHLFAFSGLSLFAGMVLVLRQYFVALKNKDLEHSR
jgi:nitric oxide reductase subunit B